MVAPRIMRAGDEVRFLTLEQRPETAAVWARLDTARVALRLRACYCSVFDECWVGDLRTTHAERVQQCNVPAVPYTLSARWKLRDEPGSSSELPQR